MIYNQNYYGAGPFGAVPNIGSVGYNMGGYYTNNYNNINPYYQRQLEQERYEQQQKHQKEQQQIRKSLLKRSTNVNGVKLKQIPYDNNDEEEMMKVHEEHQDIQKYNHLSSLLRGREKGYKSKRRTELQNHMGKCTGESYKFIDEDTDLFEFMENGYKITLDIIEQEERSRQKDLTKLYNQNAYQQLLGVHESSYTYNSLSPTPINIDDMEVTLPESIKNDEYYRRKKQFLDNILNKL